MKTLRTERKKFETLEELEKFITQNTLKGANVVRGQLYVEYQVEAFEDEAVDDGSVPVEGEPEPPLPEAKKKTKAKSKK